MRLTYLIRNDEAKERFLVEELPAGISRGEVGTYEAEGGKLYLLSFSFKGSSIAGARALSKLRCRLRDDANARLLVDDASSKFARVLYPRFAEFECKLRAAITLATCAEHDNFDDNRVKSLEELTLEGLGRQLYYDTSFQDKVKNRTKDSFTKSEVVDFIVGLREDTVWTQLFGEDSLSTIRENYYSLCDVRNKVMHHKLITEKAYDCARKMLRTAIDELDSYVEGVRSDVSYPKHHAARAVGAAKLIRENYDSMFHDLGGSLAQLSAATEAAQKLSSQIDTNSLAPLIARAAGIQEIIDRNKEAWESVARVAADSFSAIQTPALTTAIEAVGQQMQLQKLIDEGILAGLARPATSVDWSALRASALSNMPTPTFSPLSNANLPDNAIDEMDSVSNEEFEQPDSEERD